VTNARVILRQIRRQRVQAEEAAATTETNDGASEDGAQYFDADDLFEREDAEMGRDEENGWYSDSENWEALVDDQ
jgi:hypothetical protein